MIRRDLDGCPITAALQMLGDKWTMLVVRELVAGPKRTMELLADLYRSAVALFLVACATWKKMGSLRVRLTAEIQGIFNTH
jgi:hypothetical protein